MNKIVTHVAVGVSALTLGGVAGYLIAKRRVTAEYEDLMYINDQNWLERLNDAEGPAAIITSGEPLELPNEIRVPDVIIGNGDTGPIPAIMDRASELGDEALLDDFPEPQLEVADDFTVEGLPAPVDARAFVEKFKDRTVGDFGGVTFPGQVDPETLDAEQPEIPIKTVPEFVTVRDPQGPYVISIDEYMDPETDPPYTKVEMRYFAGDKVVVDARDQQVPMSTIGEKNTLRFGEGTTDASQVYIRNERLSIDIELTREAGLYLHEVLGQDFPDKTPVLKMRERDDG